VLFAVTFTIPATDAGGTDFFISGKPETHATGKTWEIIGGADTAPPLNLIGLTLVPAHPPVTGLAFEVDVRSVSEVAML